MSACYGSLKTNAIVNSFIQNTIISSQQDFAANQQSARKRKVIQLKILIQLKEKFSYFPEVSTGVERSSAWLMAIAREIKNYPSILCDVFKVLKQVSHFNSSCNFGLLRPTGAICVTKWKRKFCNFLKYQMIFFILKSSTVILLII